MVKLESMKQSLPTRARHLPLIHHLHRLDPGELPFCKPKFLVLWAGIGASLRCPAILLCNFVETLGSLPVSIKASIVVDATNGRNLGYVLVGYTFFQTN